MKIYVVVVLYNQSIEVITNKNSHIVSQNAF